MIPDYKSRHRQRQQSFKPRPGNKTQFTFLKGRTVVSKKQKFSSWGFPIDNKIHLNDRIQ